ncbi:hypothetical protein A2924_00465 [Candidatus Giovannonibacteria bacterium RIFCSPLOWO2_01_FULL_44_16]|uniref:Uncharacterized protein n=1 Tax=Candidatus Giovannonibacteria bacterium RIFCSPLOWO2_01_FULL_44_16 TaxID=1798348 RepID=A0A1F5X2N1_9BACT|nr:MAG: hypothetical protein A2924_00465 [Candidatus Giovannonibacteria bacterium RIFCSPLOWO2_01_FULL_44_16]
MQIFRFCTEKDKNKKTFPVKGFFGKLAAFGKFRTTVPRIGGYLELWMRFSRSLQGISKPTKPRRPRANWLLKFSAAKS